MKLAVLGCGLGYSLSWVLANQGHDVLGVDINRKAFEEPRIDPTMEKFIREHNYCHRQIHFTTDYSEIADREMIFIFVTTPLIDKRLSIHQVESALYSCLSEERNKVHYVLLSTMPVGGFRKIVDLYPEVEGRINYVPPQVRAGSFYSSFTNPPTGWQMMSNNAPLGEIKQIYDHLLLPHIKIIEAKPEIVEISKLVVNAFLTTKIVFANAVDDWCNTMGLDANEILKIVGQDLRIGSKYLKPNGAVGGSCLPRDCIELMSASHDTPFYDLVSVIDSLNNERAERFPSPIPVRY